MKKSTKNGLSGGLIGVSTLALTVGACAPASSDNVPDLVELESVSSSEEALSIISQKDVCFTVHNPGDPAAYTVRGKQFTSLLEGPDSTALLLQHGGFAEQSSWNGARPTVQGAGVIAPLLALAGHNVITVDRLGYGSSPYPNGGYALPSINYVEMTRELVAQIHAGTYKFAKNGSCEDGKQAKHGNDDVVLVGYSVGAGINEYYATQYDDIAGVISLAWSNMGASSIFGGLFINVIVPQVLAGADYVYPVNPELDGYSETCEEAFFYTPGMKPSALAQLCSDEYYLDPAKNKSPAAEVLGVLDFMAATAAAAPGIGDTPLLKLYADHDNLQPNANWRGPSGLEPDVVTPDIAVWTAAASDFEWGFSLDAGHNSWFAKSAPLTALDMMLWLAERGL